MQILNIAGYKFIVLDELDKLRQCFLDQCKKLALKGTILLSEEGINVSLAGQSVNMHAFKTYLREDPRFADMTFHETYSSAQPFQRLKIKLKKEIITLRQPETAPNKNRAPSISPELFKQWLDEKRDITILDTRNDYEIQFGTFEKAQNLHLNHFGDFSAALPKIPSEKPIVMFCTGGIRCEKAALYLLNQGYSNVYQLEGGILNYFAKVGGAHYQGECYVFDERIAVDANLKKTDTTQCLTCQGPIKQDNVSCPCCTES